MAKKGTAKAAGRSAAAAAPDPSAARLLSQLEEKSEQLALVNGVLRTAAGAASLSDVLRVFASNLKSICPFDRMSVSLYDPARKVFHVPYAYFAGRVVETREPPRSYGDTPLSRVIETRQPLLRKNIRQEMTFRLDSDFVRQGLGCEVIFPLLAGERPFGTFQMSCFEPGRLTERHLRLLQDILPAIAIVVHRHAGEGDRTTRS
jgi:transcriptional regulator with GAF, ATPase, and Fis domain